jgi:hypothetical protein
VQTTPLKLKENYQSALLNKGRLMKEFMKQEQAGTFVKMSPSEARAKYKQRLHVAALATLEQGSDSWRIVHDGTHGIAVINRVKVRDQISAPTGCDLEAAMRAEKEYGPFLSLVIDTPKAHLHNQTTEDPRRSANRGAGPHQTRSVRSGR